MSSLESYFGALPDPRAGNATHRLGDLIVMMIAASLCGASNATEFSLFAQERKQALSRLIAYEVAPSHDTFSRLLRLLDPEAFSRAFAAFAAGFARACEEVVSLDGKALRRAYEKGLAASPPLTVSAFAAETRLCLAAVSPGEEENEVEAALKVIELIDLTGRLVTADALHCHTRMAKAITERGGDYLLALKGNRRHWVGHANRHLAETAPAVAERTETSHGRSEWRQAEVVVSAEPLMAGHKAFIRITSRRDQAKPLTRLFMASTLLSPQQALELTRAHWQIENGLHWMLDVHLDEDQSRARKDNAPANTALLNRIARNLLQAADVDKVPISHRIKKCAWNDGYLIQAITHMR
ncbi:MAG: ISAs1 family transposase [Mesorhizobium sp.]|nr:ISAs1 family transposase [Mesorhizobium sp. M1D.F.Ca.ET.043.01.1.1]RWD97096.1 MAG: ISAs1 family transposase [Mesorhizobium sp.]AZO75711.1 ISAs1 family transposase [Mesorhizobium sp. M1D.F.Ca.ET.043.01.1.1]AZO75725.1 ISAs1 family transposase [Mesorhizobium sp. M1D.F.Ca.ET.043.01.1.1]AZO75753.1 ISAs1 family transposase [Mesorhizobium sp. M1D.F.Ca.ET.043.01.1.1]